MSYWKVLSEKSKRLKTLLAKSKQMAQEKEIEMAKLTVQLILNHLRLDYDCRCTLLQCSLDDHACYGGELNDFPACLPSFC